MDNIKNKPKFTPRTKKLVFVALCSLSLLVGLVGAFSRPYVAQADSIDNVGAPMLTKYHPLGNASITFADWGRTFITINPTNHDYPRSIGGLMGTDELGETDMYADTYVRAVHNKVTSDNGVILSLGQHIFFQNGSEKIQFFSPLWQSIQPSEYHNIQNGALAFQINTNLVLKGDCNPLTRYQFELPKNTFKIEMIGQFLYKDTLKTLTFTTPLIDGDYYPYSYDFPHTSTNNTTLARINFGQLLSELVGERFDSRRNEFVCINNLTLNFVAYRYIQGTESTFYTKMPLDELRSYAPAIAEYNSVMTQSADNPTLSLFSPVNAFLNMEIFNGFTMGYLLLICIGFSLFTLLAKVLHNS